jgi:hypothetical protein
MHTIIVIGVGLVLLAVFMLVTRQFGGGTARAAATGAVWFIPFWLLATGFNLSIGVRHGYALSEELLIALAVFGVPGAIAAAIWWRFSRGKSSIAEPDDST